MQNSIQLIQQTDLLGLTKYLQALRLYLTVQKNGELMLTGLPCQKGQRVETILLFPAPTKTAKKLTGKELAMSELVGLWKDRNITDSVAYAQELRHQAQTRGLIIL